MYNVLLDLDVAAARQHELEEDAAHERLILAAVRYNKEHGVPTLVDRLLRTLHLRREAAPSDPRNN